MKKNRGFTLIEVLAVIVIIGLILIVVFPSMTKMMRNNDDDKYEQYYDLVYEAANVYSSKLTSSLGNSKNVGCATIELDDLIDEDYVKKFNDKNVTCETGANNIVVRNNMGKITVAFQLKCTKSGEDVFLKGNNDSSTCLAYEIKEDSNLMLVLEDKGYTTITEGNEVFISGNNPENYIWYSGNLWRIVSYNRLTGIVKIVTDEPVVSLYFNNNEISSYAGSDVETWLNNEFLTRLKDQQIHLISTNWNSTPNKNFSSNPLISEKSRKARIGLINTFEFGKISSWYKGRSWLLSEGTGTTSLVANGGTISEVPSKSINAIRPTVTLTSDTVAVSGTGSKTDPFIIDSDVYGQKNDKLNTRYSGEYVQFNGKTYRIINTDGGKTKVIGTTSTGTFNFSDNHYTYSSSSLRNSLELSTTSFYKKLSASLQSYITNGDFCSDTINNANLTYRSSTCLTTDRLNSNIKIGIPKIGELYTTGISGVNSYWTLNPNIEQVAGDYSQAMMNVVNTNGTVETANIKQSKQAVIVFYFDSSVKINGGKGTPNNPYTLTK